MDKIFLFAGEASGDLLGSQLVKELSSELSLEGVVGPRMRAQGVTPFLPMEDFQVMGFSDVLKNLPKLIRYFNKIKHHILSTQPSKVVLIDYAEFNLRLATALRKAGYQGKLIHYVSPSVWAWKKDRIHQMAKSLNLLLTVFPFEAAHYAETSLKTEYVGHPLVKAIEQHTYHPDWKSSLGIPENTPIIAFFPGSRPSEIKRHLPTMQAAADLLRQKFPHATFCLSGKTSLPGFYTVPSTYTYDLMREARCAVAKSGTVTLELALHNCPTAVIYGLSKLNYFLAKYIYKLDLPFYCIVNIIQGKEVFPELIKDLNVKALATHLEKFFQHSPERNACLQGCLDVRRLLGDHSSSKLAAKAIHEI